MLAAPVQTEPVSAVQAASPAKIISTNPAQDYEEAVKLYDSGEATGDMGALIDATELFRRAADVGHAAAQARYALSFERGQDFEAALKYYRMSAAQGDRDGQYGLGSMYHMGEGVQQDFDEARKWMTLAWDQGHKVAIITLAAAYMRVKISPEEAAKQSPRIAKAYALAGMGLDEDARQSPEALAWIKRAADNDYIPALDVLAEAYRSGKYGLAIDPLQADAVAAQANKVRGVAPKVERKKSRLYKLLRGDSEDKTDSPK